MARRSASVSSISSDHGPSIRATPFLKGTGGPTQQLLTNRQRQRLLALATRLQLSARTIVYHEETPAQWIYSCGEGVSKSYRELRSGRRSVVGFLFADDLFGLAENGNYVNTVQAVTSVTLYRIPVDTLTGILRQDAELQFQFLCKVTHELRDSQRRAIAIARRDAVGRLAMFVRMLKENMASASIRGTVSVPMTRADMANISDSHPKPSAGRAAGWCSRGSCNSPTVTPCGLPTAPDSTSSPRRSERPATRSVPVLDYGQYAINEPRLTIVVELTTHSVHDLTNLLTVMNASLDWITAGATPAQVQTEYGVLRPRSTARRRSPAK